MHSQGGALPVVTQRPSRRHLHGPPVVSLADGRPHVVQITVADGAPRLSPPAVAVAAAAAAPVQRGSFCRRRPVVCRNREAVYSEDRRWRGPTAQAGGRRRGRLVRSAAAQPRSIKAEYRGGGVAVRCGGGGANGCGGPIATSGAAVFSAQCLFFRRGLKHGQGTVKLSFRIQVTVLYYQRMMMKLCRLDI